MKYSEPVEFTQSVGCIPQITIQKVPINHCIVFSFRSSLWSIPKQCMMVGNNRNINK